MRVVFTKKKMTLEEAIKHANEKAKEQGDCPCGSDHKQLAEWLEELKSFQDDFWKDGRSYKNNFTIKDADSKELAKGIEIEYEHTSDKEISRKIALDHIAEVKDSPLTYYEGLDLMEKIIEKVKKMDGKEAKSVIDTLNNLAG